MTIRKYSDTNRDEILKLLRLNTPQFFAASEEADLIYYLENHAHNFYVAIEENKILGCGGFNLADDKSVMRISWDIVHPSSQGRGVGTALTLFRINKIKEIESIKIISVRTSQHVYKFYERFGFEIKEKVKDFWAPGFDMFRMECSVDSINLEL